MLLKDYLETTVKTIRLNVNGSLIYGTPCVLDFYKGREIKGIEDNGDIVVIKLGDQWEN